MNISSLSNSITASSASAVGGLQPSQIGNGDDSDPASGSTGQVHHHHGGGGHMRSAVATALQSLGLTMPSSTDASAGTSGSTGTTSSSTSTGDGSVTAGSGSVQQDMQQFMHQLFEAVKSDSGSTTAAAGGSGGADPKSGFATGLSTLIGQVGSGTAPAGLQSAFDTLTSALQQAGGASSSSSSSSSGSGSSSDQSALQTFLTSLQQSMGYGAATSSPLGSLLTTQV